MTKELKEYIGSLILFALLFGMGSGFYFLFTWESACRWQF